jgi:hypothetical protein
MWEERLRRMEGEALYRVSLRSGPVGALRPITAGPGTFLVHAVSAPKVKLVSRTVS